MSLGVKATHALFGLILQLFFSGFVFWLRFSRESLIWFKVFSAFLSLFSPVLFFSFNIRLLTSFFPLQIKCHTLVNESKLGDKTGGKHFVFFSQKKKQKKFVSKIQPVLFSLQKRNFSF